MSFEQENGLASSFKFNDRPTSDVVVRLRTPEGRDEWLYCHSSILVKKSKYFADRLSDTWPTCQILDARTCVEVHCQESDFDYNITLLRLLYVSDSLISESWHGVRNTLGILRVAVELGCPQIITSSVEYLEAVPWEEAEEEEILHTIPAIGPTANSILARLQPVDHGAIWRIFTSAIRFATSSPPPSLKDLKSSAQEQLEYMLAEDDDAPLLTSCDELKLEVRDCIKRLLLRFSALLESLLNELEETVFEAEKFELLQSYLSDLSWACQISSKLEIMRDLVIFWLEVSDMIVKLIEKASSKVEILEIKMKVVEVATKVLEAVGYGNVVLPTAKRLHMVKLWLPFARVTKPLIDTAPSDTEEDNLKPKIDCEVWQTLESAFVSIILALPSVDQSEILTEWLDNQHIQYPDLTEAFEVWCYRSKVAKKRLAPFAASLL
ncbi:BTB/POZ domain-containing protein At3g05675-like isoform X1 [Chenopodium quinoa]|uniref:BTB/POZ domain-containing protein At3g05675-like isoform X1 n=1 Tax=Chenopodium quinoa TaxID=63459 RepID=UPI000B78AC3E|nr:BTB/POZ domain-containing protein At3g05675-like isoform X1 [Chenopodium quinoa]XP_021769608.1 BTB/POZ domain-containing protein At3g05675-like isoform X1 [Chenopodium quinoa]XP_021769609.1 BTB/POZ domain-containing protein At3g05675-like isoform X1 [Chenopodium quinoa]